MDSKRFPALAVVAAMLLAAIHPVQAQNEPPPPPPQQTEDPAPAQGQVTAESLFETIIARADQMADEPYAPPQTAIPQQLADLNYHEYRAIRFRPEQALWNGIALFEVQMFHPGFLYEQPVQINELRNGEVRQVNFDPALFRYEHDAAPLREIVPEDLGFAGFRVHYPINTAEYKDEVLVFLGASYFRLVGRDQVYGLSSRGLAIDTAVPSGEEFPRFTEFWLVHPGAQGTTLTILALLDSPSVTGAYRFDVTPTNHTVVDVDARLFARADVAKLGVAPLTSMFMHGEPSSRRVDDFRPEVHDSDGLLMHTSSGEWIWRPLSNPTQLHVSSLRDQSPRGFGLLQRDRDFDNYLDAEARYDLRPSQWVALGDGDWGQGGVELVEIPSNSEINDNIVAYWVPDAPFRAGDQRRYRYQLTTFGAGIMHRELASVVRTRNGWGAAPGQPNPPPREVRQFIVDFRGGELSTLSDSHPVEAHLSQSTGQIEDLRVLQLPDGRTWRVAFKLTPEGSTPSDLRLVLRLRGRTMSETWSYVWYPDELQ
jgi:glucans biosynthesis protein